MADAPVWGAAPVLPFLRMGQRPGLAVSPEAARRSRVALYVGLSCPASAVVSAPRSFGPGRLVPPFRQSRVY